MDKSEELNEFAAALAKAQGQIDDASKDSKNPYYNSKYADLASVRALIREPLANNGLSVVQLPTASIQGVEVETIILHSSGQFIKNKLFIPLFPRVNKEGKLTEVDAHAIGSGISYARRYSLMSMLALAADDDDGNAATVKPAVQQQKTPTNEKALAEANAAAGQGSASLRDWWQNLPKDVRDSFTTDALKSLKSTAAAVDAKTKGAE